jgi:hypothetical protein
MLCETCKKKECLVEGKGYGKPCRKVEKLLPKPYTGKKSRNEHSFDPNVLEIMAGKQACELKFGMRKEPKRPEE